MVAGPVMNFILAWCVFVGIYMHIGYVVDAPLAIVNGVVEGSVASEAGFTYGDEIVKVTFSDGTVIEPDDFYDITMYSQYYTDETIYTVLRNGTEVDLTVTPEFNEEEQRYMIGIVAPESHVRQLTFVETIKEGNAYFWDSVDLMIESIQMLVKGIGLDSLSGPVGIYTMTEQQVSYGFLSFLSLVGLLSLNVGFMNLLPVPMFDGGRMLITAVEMVIKRKIPERLEVALMWGSLLLIVALFILTTVNDVSRLLG
jgi:regulator of sigma E protease